MFQNVKRRQVAQAETCVAAHCCFADTISSNPWGRSGWPHLDWECMPSTMIGSSTLPFAAALDTEPPPPVPAHHGLEKLGLVIPTLCEAENIGGLLSHVRTVLDPFKIPYEILVVDD